MTCLLPVPRNRSFLPYWPVRAELFLRMVLGKQKASAFSICTQGFKRTPSTRKRSCSHMKQSSGAAEVDTVDGNLFQWLPLTWQALFWNRPSTVCTMLSLAQTRCHLTALSPHNAVKPRSPLPSPILSALCPLLNLLLLPPLSSPLCCCHCSCAPLARQFREQIHLTLTQQRRGQCGQAMWPRWQGPRGQGGSSPGLTWQMLAGNRALALSSA